MGSGSKAKAAAAAAKSTAAAVAAARPSHPRRSGRLLAETYRKVTKPQKVGVNSEQFLRSSPLKAGILKEATTYKVLQDGVTGDEDVLDGGAGGLMGGVDGGAGDDIDLFGGAGGQGGGVGGQA